jgi:putative SOS response-associated peptidase YedK
MCFSAQTWTDYRKYVRQYGAAIDIQEFVRLYGARRGEGSKIPKGMDAAFATPASEPERQIKALIDEYNEEQVFKLEQELFKQAKRLADAERTLQTKPTKKALNDQRVAGNKVSQIKTKIADVKRTDIKERDNRIFPLVYAPVLIIENGQRIVRPMRYQCRLAGKPASYDVDYNGTYNARRNNLEGFWRKEFGHQHGLIVATTFYENVEGPDGKNQVLKFTPKTGEPMLIACLWSHWKGQGDQPDLYSFAAITDEPEPEVAAAGHDRTIINIKPEHIDAWLNPDPANLKALYAIFDDKAHPYYEHQLAA